MHEPQNWLLVRTIQLHNMFRTDAVVVHADDASASTGSRAAMRIQLQRLFHCDTGIALLGYCWVGESSLHAMCGDHASLACVKQPDSLRLLLWS